MNLNQSQATQEPQVADLRSPEFRIVKITFYVLIFVLSCLGNSLVAIVITRAKELRSNSSNLLILNLALCDLLTPAISIPFDLALGEVNFVWLFGEVTCKLLWPCQTALSTSSTLTLAAISMDRFRALAKPMSGRFSRRQTRLVVLAIHAFSVSLVVPYILALRLNYDDTRKLKSCVETWPGDGYRQTYTLVLFLFQYAFPLVTMCIAYILIHFSLRANAVRLFSMGNRHWGSTNTTASKRLWFRSDTRSSTSSSKSIEATRKEQNIRLAKMFVIVVAVFAVSMFPNQVLWLWVDFGNGSSNDMLPFFSAVCLLFTYTNSVLNPVIYALKSREFRAGYAKIGLKTFRSFAKMSRETKRLVLEIGSRAFEAPNHASNDGAPEFDQRTSSSSEKQLNTVGKSLKPTGLEEHNAKTVEALAHCEISANDLPLNVDFSVADNVFQSVKYRQASDMSTENVNQVNSVNETIINELFKARSLKLMETLRETDCWHIPHVL